MLSYVDPIEVVRSALCTLTYRRTDKYEPVHILKIKSLCERLGLVDVVQDLLDQLKLLREIESIGGGYWVPTAQRVVQFPNFKLVISPNSTAELRRWICADITRPGIGRVTGGDVIVPLPEEPVDKWIGSPSDLKKWTRQELIQAARNLRPTVHPSSEVTVYAPWRQSRNRNGGGSRWCKLADLTMEEGADILLCRIEGVTGRIWFFARAKDGLIVEECEIVGNQLRLLYGLDAIRELRTTIKESKLGERQRIVLKMPIPFEEKRILLAFTKMSQEANAVICDFTLPCRPVVEIALRRLGFSLE